MQIALRINIAILIILSLNHLPRRVTPGLRIPADIHIGVHPLPVPLHLVRRQKHPGYWVIIARVEVVQAGQAIIVLSNEALRRVDAAGRVAPVAIGAEELIALHRGAACRPTDLREDAAQRVGQQKGGIVGVHVSDQTAAQDVVIRVGLVAATAAVLMLFQAKGIGDNGGSPDYNPYPVIASPPLYNSSISSHENSRPSLLSRIQGQR